MLHVVRASAQNDDTCRKKTREVPRVTLCEVSTNLTMATHNEYDNITGVQGDNNRNSGIFLPKI